MSKLQGMVILVTAGPTYEAIDPVRFIGNHSSGKMGIMIAEEAARQGAQVTLVCGPSAVKSSANIARKDVTSAQEMYDYTVPMFKDADIAILCAAVADYRPKNIAAQKIKKANSSLTIELEPTPDILAELGRRKISTQILVGFALETENGLENAKEKMKRKNCDMIVLNSLSDEGAGFGHNTNRVTVLDRQGNIATFGLETKAQVAMHILEIVSAAL
jgi:phosphopantothenoylcysteine decarboxylase/phosphopantothenate--cysteine ligase